MSMLEEVLALADRAWQEAVKATDKGRKDGWLRLFHKLDQAAEDLKEMEEENDHVPERSDPGDRRGDDPRG